MSHETAPPSDTNLPTANPPKKHPYTRPELTEHGSAKEVTLQTFFGSFSPTPPPP